MRCLGEEHRDAESPGQYRQTRDVIKMLMGDQNRRQRRRILPDLGHASQ